MTPDPNLAMLERIAEALGPLRHRMVFLGGCATGLLITDPAAAPIRATRDVDVIVETPCSATIRFPGRVASKADVTVDPRLNRTEARLPQAFRSVLFGRAWGVPTDSEGNRLRGRSRVSSQGRVSGRAVGMWESRRGAKRSRATSTFP